MPILRRDSLADQVGQHLLKMIRDQELKPGDTLPSEAVLTTMFGVSRPVIREALMHLKSLGIIETQSGKPSTIRRIDSHLLTIFFEYSMSLSDDESYELLEVRRGLEIQSALLAAQHATDSDVTNMQSIAKKLKTCLTKTDYEGFADLDVQLHLQIARSTGNMVLLHLIEAIREPMRRTILVGIESRSSTTEVQYLHELHERIISAIADRDEKEAGEAMAMHFDKALVSILGSRSERPHQRIVHASRT